MNQNSEIQNEDVKTAKHWQHLAYGVFTLTLIVLSILGYWLIQPSNVLVVKNGPLPVRPQEVNANGGQIIATVDFCKNSSATGKIVVYLAGNNGAKIDVNWPDDTLKKGCKKFDIPIPIPAQTPTGEYHVVFEATYMVSPIKNSFTTFQTQTFKVVNDKLQPGDAKVM